MRTPLVPVIFFFTLAFLQSCTKNYDCECTNGNDAYTYELLDVKKSDATEACQLAGSVWIENGGSCVAKTAE